MPAVLAIEGGTALRCMTATGILFICLVFASSALWGQCKPPRYKRGRTYKTSQSEIMMQVSIEPSELAPGRLVCLAESIKRKYPGKRSIWVTIYDEATAAKRALPLTVEASPGELETATHMHAVYRYDANKGEEYIELFPDWREKRYVTRINIPPPSAIQCTLQAANRCVLSLAHIDYPWEARKQELSGRVSLGGAVTANGTVRDVTVTDAESNSKEGKSLLVEAAQANLKSWRFEPGVEDFPIHITYTYRLVSSPFFEHGVDTQISLPNDVVITANPVH